jgi:uncharacterized YigZ family protein
MLDIDTYHSLRESCSGEYREKGSKFIGFSYPVESDRFIKDRINSLKKDHAKANHHCYAYRLGYDGTNEFSTDDREPSGSAGRPILGVLKSKNLTDVLIVVIRYFGGIQLGIPGLINAYKQATLETLKYSRVITKVHHFKILVECKYDILNNLYRITRKLNGSVKIVKTDSISIRANIEVPFSKRVELLESIQTNHMVSENCKIIEFY